MLSYLSELPKSSNLLNTSINLYMKYTIEFIFKTLMFGYYGVLYNNLFFFSIVKIFIALKFFYLYNSIANSGDDTDPWK